MPIPSVYLEALRTLSPEPVEIVGGGVECQSTARFLLAAGNGHLLLLRGL